MISSLQRYLVDHFFRYFFFFFFFFNVLFSQLSSSNRGRFAYDYTHTPLCTMLAYILGRHNVFDVFAFGLIPLLLYGRQRVSTVCFVLFFFFIPNGPRDIWFFFKITTVTNTNYLWTVFMASAPGIRNIVSLMCSRQRLKRQGYDRFGFFYFFILSFRSTYLRYKYVYRRINT